LAGGKNASVKIAMDNSKVIAIRVTKQVTRVYAKNSSSPHLGEGLQKKATGWRGADRGFDHFYASIKKPPALQTTRELSYRCRTINPSRL
jgi:hypothetical protein